MKRKVGVRTWRRRHRAMSERELLLRRVLHSLPVHVVGIDGQGRVTYANSSPQPCWNPAALPCTVEETGACYLSGLRQSAQHGDGSAAELLAGLSSVLRGERPHFKLEYTRTIEGERHSLQVDIDPIDTPVGGAVICYVDTTDRSRDEESLREIHDRYTFATLAGGVALWDLDLRTRDLYVDPSLIELLGYDRGGAETTVVDWTAVTTAQDRAEIRAAVVRCLRGEARAFEFEHRLFARDGRTLWFLTRGDVVAGPDGKPVRLIGLSTDTTARKEAELAIEREREKYRQIFDAAGVAIWEADYSVVARWLRRLRAQFGADLSAYLERSPLPLRALAAVRLRDINGEAVRLTGASDRDALLARPLTDLLLEAEPLFRKQLQALAAGRTSFESEAAILTASGEKRDIVLVVRFPAGAQELDSVLICAQDVTALVERRRRFELATAAGSVTVFELELRTQRLHTDPPLHTLLGYEPDQPATLRDLLDCMHPDDADRLRITEQALQSNRAPRDHQGNTPIPDLEFRLFDDAANCRWFLKRGSVIREADGSATRLVGTITEITNHIRIEQKVRNSHQQVRELARRLIAAQEHEQTRIARDLHDGQGVRVAHLMTGLAELEAMLGDVPDSVRAEIRRLQTEIGELAQGIRSLSKQMHPGSSGYTQLRPALRRLCDEFSRVPGLEVRFDFDADDDAVPALTMISLFRVTQEALRNVAQHSGASLAQVSVSRREDALQLCIRDWGKGYHAAAGSARGLGLLSIQERARLAGGRASVYSAPGRGTEVRVNVPITPDPLLPLPV